jgi:hypothetical protein
MPVLFVPFSSFSSIFGELGHDTIQGEGSIGLTVSATVDASGLLTVQPSVEAARDIGDYIEGNGGADLIFGNLGQDDIIGGSSNLYSLTAASQRPDSADRIFGGAGTDISRNNAGDVNGSGHGIGTTGTQHIAGRAKQAGGVGEFGMALRRERIGDRQRLNQASCSDGALYRKLVLGRPAVICEIQERIGRIRYSVKSADQEFQCGNRTRLDAVRVPPHQCD